MRTFTANKIVRTLEDHGATRALVSALTALGGEADKAREASESVLAETANELRSLVTKAGKGEDIRPVMAKVDSLIGKLDTVLSDFKKEQRSTSEQLNSIVQVALDEMVAEQEKTRAELKKAMVAPKEEPKQARHWVAEVIQRDDSGRAKKLKVNAE